MHEGLRFLLVQCLHSGWYLHYKDLSFTKAFTVELKKIAHFCVNFKIPYIFYITLKDVTVGDLYSCHHEAVNPDLPPTVNNYKCGHNSKALSHEQHRTLIPVGKGTPNMSHTFYPCSLPRDNFLIMAWGCVWSRRQMWWRAWECKRWAIGNGENRQRL